MERKFFLRQGLTALGAAFVMPLAHSCQKEDTTSPTTTTTTDGSSTTTTGTCTVAPTETEGPFPTHSPSSYVRSDIRDDREGYELSATITIGKVSNSCAALANVIVDIWHCDAAGNYSEYGGTQMQSTNYTSVHFLRGRQVTDANGQVKFTSIFPGWYQGRATHIHVHIFDAAGNSLNITQIAFPEGTGSALLAVSGYSKGMSGYTYNASDSIFKDDTTGVQLATVSGSTSSGFTLAIQLNVA
ncbi:MAG TPA: intradiol ring-cleavage dioxygenase [Flavihumibacter sp.]|mgnify:CR=1 FL=1|nr:intradiol ring-cleavage dioxygenase [Bacteroidota bacterium]HOA37234.1 intradiol ring-cleavage dioxygenase [Flavihumibacter sp.]HPZ86955.1 intradiol ring-cleavage dioxygenase [Flavihumibacter sp.]HQD08306.1 intradiol ring-cleavage dioxygenase [Flavihumibacter sp.]